MNLDELIAQLISLRSQYGNLPTAIRSNVSQSATDYKVTEVKYNSDNPDFVVVEILG